MRRTCSTPSPSATIGVCGVAERVCGTNSPVTRGSALNSRLANRFPDRFLGFAFLALGYFPPSPEFDIDSVLAQSKAAFGYELYGYWPFLSRDDAHEIVERNVRLLVAVQSTRMR
jgi:hypothetical protein